MANEYMLDTLDTIKSWFDTYIDATLSDIETARSLDPDSISRPASITTHLNLDDQTPFIEVLPDDSAHEYGTDDSPYAEEHWNYHGASILISHYGYDPGEVQTTLLYYAEAVERMVKRDYTFGNVFNRVRLISGNYALLITSQEDKLIKQTIEQIIEVRAFSE